MLLIDNVDSFTFNVADLLHRVLGRAPTVWRRDHPATEDDLLGFDAIVVGPGPGRPQHPEDMGISDTALRQRQVPVLGVCLGHQGMAHLAGDDVAELAEPMHGRVSRVHHDGTGILAGVPSPIEVVRYHSLEVRCGAGSPLQATAWAEDDGCVMVLTDPGAGHWGVQFHPESVLSEHGTQIVGNFLVGAGVPVGPRPPDDSGPVAVGDVPQTRARRRRPVREGAVRAVSMPARVDTWRLHARLVSHSATSVWLDAPAGARDGAEAAAAARFSVIGDATGPLAYRLTHRVGQGTTVHAADGNPRLLPGPLLPNLENLLGAWEVVEDVDLPTSFRPGFVGYLGYELRTETAPGPPATTRHESTHPDAWLVFADRAVVVDHHTDTVHLVYLEDRETRTEQHAWVERVRAVVAEEARRGPAPWPEAPPAAGEDVVAGALRHTEPEYLDLIGRCQQQIRAGESYEVCLTNMVRWPTPVDEARAYRLLRAASPAPFGAWLRGPELSVLGASPERFVAVGADGTVEARPIKGTRPRDPDPGRDAALAAGLAGAGKDRAENLMIVDLLRNDLHRVCRSGSVHVPELFAVESYATVHQLVSTIRGRLADRMGATDVLGSCFPGGSMTGAPKVRTMEILDHLEDGPRGVYSGALGWIGVTGAMDTSIVIRSATLVGGVVEFGIGGAVTALSDPDEEFAETLHKSRAIASALVAADRPIGLQA